ncbi:MAG: YggS family pyridoxal phosphate-dependent enzyme [Pirellula sp.]|nr:YggS family pyridoxal phosphate-dependent enzyme [Pirellula sp.]
MNANVVRTERIRENYRQVLTEVAAAESSAGRASGSVRVVAVTKYVGVSETLALVEAGCLDLGESRPQSLWDKASQVPALVRWHLIGHLQRNKVRRTLPFLHLMHSLDSQRLSEQIERDASELGVRVSVLLEINITQDGTKTGMQPVDAEVWLERYAADEGWRDRIRLLGLMGMSSLDADASQARREFASLRERCEAWNDRFGLEMSELSMGMSHDFASAIAEGATLVRIGSRLFEGVEP